MGLLRHFCEKNILKKYKVVTFYYLLTNLCHQIFGKLFRKRYHKSDKLISVPKGFNISSVGHGNGPCNGQSYSKAAAFSASGGISSVESVKKLIKVPGGDVAAGIGNLKNHVFIPGQAKVDAAFFRGVLHGIVQKERCELGYGVLISCDVDTVFDGNIIVFSSGLGDGLKSSGCLIHSAAHVKIGVDNVHYFLIHAGQGQHVFYQGIHALDLVADTAGPFALAGFKLQNIDVC